VTIRAVACAIVLGIAVVACGSAATVTPPASLATPPSPTASPSAAASPTPSATATPTASAAASTSASAATCAVERQTGLLPSDRMTNVEILGLPGRDVVRFSFGDRSLEPKGPATGTLDVATPPFTGGASGLPIDLKGEHALQVVFRGMSLQNDVGQLAYDGPREFVVSDPTRSLRHLVLYDESEGQLGWYAGYDGPSCVTLTRNGDTVELAFDFAPGT
jgi:hypothetical protein